MTSPIPMMLNGISNMAIINKLWIILTPIITMPKFNGYVLISRKKRLKKNNFVFFFFNLIFFLNSGNSVWLFHCRPCSHEKIWWSSWRLLCLQWCFFWRWLFLINYNFSTCCRKTGAKYLFFFIHPRKTMFYLWFYQRLCRYRGEAFTSLIQYLCQGIHPNRTLQEILF